jgi:hypothetical protein
MLHKKMAEEQSRQSQFRPKGDAVTLQALANRRTL